MDHAPIHLSDLVSGDELYRDAVRIASEMGGASALMLQRRLRIDHGRAVHLMEMMQKNGIAPDGKTGSAANPELLPHSPQKILEEMARLVVEKLPLDDFATLVANKLPLNKLVDLVIGRMSLGEEPERAQSESPEAGLSMEPFFLPSKTSQAIMRLLPPSRQRKWTAFFTDWGCVRCGQGENRGIAHSSNGLCGTCRTLVQLRLVGSIKKRLDDDGPSTEAAVAAHKRRRLTSDDLAELSHETIMEPWFLPKAIETAIGQLLPISKRRRWNYYFLDWGCLRCSRIDLRHSCHGMCKRCALWVHYHLGASVKRHFAENGPTSEDLTARLTLRASTAQRIFAGDEVLPLNAPEEASPADIYELWKAKLGRGCARMIDALSIRGELSTNELAAASGLTLRTVQENLVALRRNTLVESHNGRHVLRKPCEDCRQMRQTCFRGTTTARDKR